MAKQLSSPARRILYRAVLPVFAAVALGVSLVLFTGATLRLPYLPGAVLERVNLRLDGYRIAVQTGQIAWTPASGEVGVVLRGATLGGPSGGVFLTVESAEVSGQVRFFADDWFRPVGLAVTGASAELLATAEGRTFLLAPTGERLPLAALLPVSGGADNTVPENISLQNGRLSWRRESAREEDAAAGVLRLDATRQADGLIEALIAFDSLPLSLVAPDMSGTALGGGQVSVVLESGQRSASLSGAVDFRIEDLAASLPVRGPGSLDVEARIDLFSDGAIERVSGKLAVRDQEFSTTGTETGAEAVEVEVAEALFTVDPEANRIGLTGLHLASSAGAFGGRAEFTHSPAGLEGQVELHDVWLAGFVPVGDGARLDRVSAAVTVSPAGLEGQVELHDVWLAGLAPVGDGARLDRVSAAVTVSPAGLEGQVELHDVWLAGLAPAGDGARLDRVSAAVTASPARGIWEVLDGRASAGGLEAVFRARVEGPDIDAQMSIPEFGLMALLDAWPAGIVPAVRESVVQNLRRGQFGVELMLSGPLSDLEPRFEFTFSGVDAMPGAGFPDIRNAHGSGKFGGGTLSAVLSRGTLDLQQVIPAWAESGAGEIEIAGKLESGLDAVSGRPGSELEIEGVVRLTAPAELGDWMLSEAEFPLALHIAEGSGGGAEFVLQADFSILEVAHGGLRLKEAGIPGDLVARGELSETGLHLSSAELGIGTSRFFAHYPESPEDDPPILISGNVGPDLLSGLGAPLLGPAPLEARIARRADGRFEFSVLLELTDTDFVLPGTKWSKPAGAPGKIRLVGTSDGQDMRVEKFLFDLEGFLVEGTWQAGTGSEPWHIDLERVRIGSGTRIVGRAGRAGEGEYWLRVVGGTIDVRDLDELTKISDTGTGGLFSKARVHISGDLHRFHLAEVLWIEDAEGDFNIAVGEPAGGAVDEPVVGTVKGKMFGELPAEFSLGTGPEGKVQIRIEVEDAGEVLRGLGILDNAHGGRVVLSSTPENDPDAPGKTYRIDIEDVSFRNTPFYANLLSFISGVGLVQYLLDGETRFSHAEVYVTSNGDVLELRKGKLEGLSLGMTFAGDYNIATSQIDLQGYVIPVRFLSRLLGQVPVLGRLVEDENGTASFGIKFGVSGSPGDVDFEFQPLSLLIPFLPRLLPPEASLGADSPPPPEQ